MQKGSPRAQERWIDPTKRGNCLCLPEKPASAAALKALGLQGIEYIDGEPQFGTVSIGTVEIDMMTAERDNVGKPSTKTKFEDILNDPDTKDPYESYLGSLMLDYDAEGGILGNFAQADIRLAKKWNREKKDGHGWTPADVAKFREINKFTWHECPDRETMMLVPTCIHKDFPHYGGVSARKEVDKEHTWWSQLTGEIDDANRWGDTTGASNLHLILTVGVVVISLITFFTHGISGFLGLLFWLIAEVGPYALFLFFCLKKGGLSEKLRSKTGGWILLILFGLLHILVPLIVELLFFVYLVLGVLAIVNGITTFGPSGLLTITRTDEHGRTTHETQAVYGDMDSAVSQAKRELRDEGFSDIREE